VQGIVSGLELADPCGRAGLLDRADKKTQGQRFVINSDNMQKITSNVF
jgi:hypothetical protein